MRKSLRLIEMSVRLVIVRLVYAIGPIYRSELFAFAVVAFELGCI